MLYIFPDRLLYYFIFYFILLSTLILYFILFHFIVYFNTLIYVILFHFIVYFSILFISFSLVSIHAVFLFLLCTETLEQKQFPLGISQVF